MSNLAVTASAVILSVALGPADARAQEATEEDVQGGDVSLMEELAAAAEEDTAELEKNTGKDHPVEADRAEEDPLEKLPQGAKEVIGNEANPALSIILDFAGAYFSDEQRIKLGGHAPATNGPAIQGAELAASAWIDPYFRIDMAFGMWHRHMEEIYATTTALPFNLQVRAGKFKSLVGRHNPTHLHAWRFVVHPVANQFLFGAEGLAPPGVELSVLLPLPWYVEVVGALQMGDSGSFRTPFVGKDGGDSDPVFEDFIYPLRVVQFFDFSDDWAGQLGLNAVFGPSQLGPEVGNRTYAYGIDWLLKWRPIGWGETGYTFIAWVVEGWLRQMEVPEDVWEDAGGYTDLIFGIDKRWEAALRGELWRRLSGEDDILDVDRNKFGLNTVRGSAALSFMPSHFSRVRLQYTFEHTAEYGDNHIGLVQLEVSAGAHGAHAY